MQNLLLTSFRNGQEVLIFKTLSMDPAEQDSFPSKRSAMEATNPCPWSMISFIHT
jgi:hypothetical protein